MPSSMPRSTRTVHGASLTGRESSQPVWAGRPLALVGPTASGKSALALEVAAALAEVEHLQVELVSVDSMQVYRGMDVGTAKPSAAERASVPHHLLDLLDPTEDFDVARFQAAAKSAVAGIIRRGAVPVLVGGTGLYLRAVIDDLQIPGRYPTLRCQLEAEASSARLYERLTRLDPVAAAKTVPSNRRRVIRALEVTLGSGRAFSSYGAGLSHYPTTPYVQVALDWDRDQLDSRIVQRFQRQLADGFMDEVRRLADLELSHTAVEALGYRELLAHLRGECSLAEAIDEAVTRTRRFARRQMRWFRRDPRIHWLTPVAPVAAADVVDDVVDAVGAAVVGEVLTIWKCEISKCETPAIQP